MKFKQEIETAAKNNEVPSPILASIVYIESSFRPAVRRYEKFLDKEENNHKEIFNQFKNYSDLPKEDDKKWEGDASYGLCQLLGDTAIWLGWRPKSKKGFEELYDVETNLDLGAKYLRDRYEKYPEITRSNKDRWEMAIAAYNAGRGNINKMLALARNAEGKEKSKDITIKDQGKWQTWDYASKFLPKVTGDKSKYTIKYVNKLRRKRKEYAKEFEKFSQEPPEEVKQREDNKDNQPDKDLTVAQLLIKLLKKLFG